jgi:hypothetical protein
MEKDAYYFPHFCNARHDRKIKRVTKELGVEGYGIFFMLLEVLREQTDFKFPLSDVDLLADEFGTSEQKVLTVISKYKLFNIDEEEMFFSPKLVFYLQPYLNMKEQRRQAGIKSGIARKNKALKLNDRSTDVQRELNENEQSKVKESKVKEIKHIHGEYGWIKLSDKEYQKINEDYKEIDVNNQIKLLDEYIQGNGNKNKYKDWNLVLRKSIRDNWFDKTVKKEESTFKSCM